MATQVPHVRPFDYRHVRLVPGECKVRSRSEVSTAVEFGGREFKLPIVPANMSSIVDVKTAVWLAEQGYFYVMHRFDHDPVALTQKLHGAGVFASVSLGVQSADRQAVQNFVAAGVNPEYVTIDIAHGDSPVVCSMIELLREKLPHTFIIAGNVATAEAARRLEAAGAHAIKVGVGPGLACITSPNTGFGTRDWQLSAVEWCAQAVDSAKIIADGGIRENGDIAKALAFGADMVMIGGALAGHDENPGELIEDEEGNRFKEFFGSASEHQKGEKKHVEGKRMLLPYKGSLTDTLRTIQENLQSAVSYSGGVTIADLYSAQYVLLP